MARKLKTYMWLERHVNSPLNTNHHGEANLLVAAESKIAAFRLAGYDKVPYGVDVYETGNTEDVDFAMAHPNQVFWYNSDEYSNKNYYPYEVPEWRLRRREAK